MKLSDPTTKTAAEIVRERLGVVKYLTERAKKWAPEAGSADKIETAEWIETVGKAIGKVILFMFK